MMQESKKVKVFIERMDSEIVLPFYVHVGDSGMDVKASQDIIIGCGETLLIPTGIKVAVPVGYEIQVRARSGISYKTPLRVTNGIGTIDAPFRDEIKVIMQNTSPSELKWNITDLSKGGEGIYKIYKGDRIAQLVLAEVPVVDWVEVDSVEDIGYNRSSGFGGSGVK